MNEEGAFVLTRGDAAISYRRRGDGPPLILLHATLSSSRQLRTLARRLAQTHTVVSVDRRESGESQLPPAAPTGAVSVAVHVADLAELIAEESLAPALVVGHSYGGCLALELSARHPELVARTWVYEPPYAAVGSDRTRQAMELAGRLTTEAGEASGPGAAAEVFMASVSSAAAVEALSPGARERVRAAGRGAIADATLLGMDPSGLPAIECPVMIATGTASSPLYAQLAGALAASIRHASVEPLAGLDHMAPITRPDVVAASIEAFASP